MDLKPFKPDQDELLEDPNLYSIHIEGGHPGRCILSPRTGK